VARLVAQEQEALRAGLEVLGVELREVDASAGAGGEVEEAAPAGPALPFSGPLGEVDKSAP
jgi:hypothetical protein